MKKNVLFLLLQLSCCYFAQAQAPNISYTGVNSNYCIGNAITALSPSNTGGVVSLSGFVSVLAGGTSAGTSSGNANGTGAAATFSGLYGVAVDGSGNVYVADKYNNLIRKISSTNMALCRWGNSIPSARTAVD